MDETRKFKFFLGQRVHSVGNPYEIATVRFIGPVVGHRGDWVGVEWDDASRGRHDGMVDGHRYFQCEVKGAGSLVRPQKIVSGVSIAEALRSRYKLDQEESNKSMFIISVRNRPMEVEFVGREKALKQQSRLDERSAVILSASSISTIGKDRELNSLAKNIEEIDLSYNLFSEWKEVVKLKNELPKLNSLSLSHSRLNFNHSPLNFDDKNWNWNGLKILILNFCKLKWNDINLLKKFIENIEVLHLSNNEISSFSECYDDEKNENFYIDGFNSLKILNLEKNNIFEWNQIFHFAYLPCLEQLNLNENKIKQVKYFDFFDSKNPNPLLSKTKFQTMPFSSLHTLLLGNNEIDDLNSINEFNKFPSLTELRISENPITKNSISNSNSNSNSNSFIPRHFIIARIKNIKVLNGSEIKMSERRDEEIGYVHHVMSYMANKTKEEIVENHPRFYEILEERKMAFDQEYANALMKSKNIKNYLNITFRVLSTNLKIKKMITKKLPLSTNVSKIKVLCEKLFKLNSANFLLCSMKDKDFPLPLLNDNETVQEMKLDDDDDDKNACIIIDDDKNVFFRDIILNDYHALKEYQKSLLKRLEEDKV